MSEVLSFTLNGEPREVAIREDMTLLEVLRQTLKLVTARESCGIGVCGSCTVIVDGQQVSSCLMLAAQAVDRSVETLESMTEGIAGGDDGRAPGTLHPIQQAFIDHNAFQCSFCTPGFLLATRELLAESPSPTSEEVRHFLAGNLCRCGSYLKIEEAVLDAAARLRGEQREGATQ
jgi:aerobic-type carbon monoxide dehydrogenase small subunit (CoxS/CutS family)